MADAQIGNLHGVTDRQESAAAQIANQSGYADANQNTIAAMRARLAVINAGLYTAAYLNTMTYNDMMYAIRLADAPTSV